MLFLVSLAIGATSQVNAMPLAPVGFGPDTGATYFTPNTEVLGFELFDILEPATSVGFFFSSTPGTLITLFDGTDTSGGGASQVAYTNFTTGQIYDVDSGVLTPESFFVPKVEDIGFFLSIGSTTIYSDPSLNGGLDLFSAFPSLTESGKWAFIFEGIAADGSLTPINLTLIDGVTVPEPSIIALIALGVPFMLVISYRRRKYL